MASNVNVNVPTSGNATTASIRSNFATIKSEIEALQSTTGAVGYTGSAGAAGAQGAIGYTGSAGAAGAAGTTAYDLTGSVFGAYTTSETVMRYRAGRAVTISSDQTNGRAVALTAATASTVFTLSKNGTSVGTVTFGAGATTGTISIPSTVSLAIGDLFAITAPATVDATLADIDFTLIANV